MMSRAGGTTTRASLRLVSAACGSGGGPSAAPGAGPGQIAGIGFECLAAEKAPHGVCRVETVRKVFFLGPDYRPGPSFWSLETAVDIPSGEIETWTLK